MAMINYIGLNNHANTIIFAGYVPFINMHNSLENLSVLREITLENSKAWYSSNGFLVNNEEKQILTFNQKSEHSAGSNAKVLGILTDKKNHLETTYKI